jgi:DNA-binding transcriptional regulator GbsR (MarR family)
MEKPALDRFVESWGSMGVLWGINRSMARVHALLLVSEEPLGLDDLAERLQISRGNVSMCLKELRSWGVIRRTHRPGERRDYYLPESDAWSMLFRIASERKKREYDPALAAIREALDEADLGGEEVRRRLRALEELLGTMDRVLVRLLANEEVSRAMLTFLTAQVGGGEES